MNLVIVENYQYENIKIKKKLIKKKVSNIAERFDTFYFFIKNQIRLVLFFCVPYMVELL